MNNFYLKKNLHFTYLHHKTAHCTVLLCRYIVVCILGLSVKDVRSSLAVLVQHGLVTFSDKRRPGTADYTLEVSLEMQHGLVTFCDKRRPGTADYMLEVGFEVEYQKFFV
jgi:hypothetical protein